MEDDMRWEYYMAQSEIDKFSVEEIPENDEIIPSNSFRADYLHTRYEALLWRYDTEKAKSDDLVLVE
ncbi:hypothetical protein H5410_014255 [Solanum commersonii]|uniref:Uncharacterized protein n=1 Tax=Solanum commersonii TaxID=4109 RepID=A0A9J5ZQW4_SOLCO|nr:hypothetical protein H5410_014255 [Solanum commersonii]